MILSLEPSLFTINAEQMAAIASEFCGAVTDTSEDSVTIQFEESYDSERFRSALDNFSKKE